MSSAIPGPRRMRRAVVAISMLSVVSLTLIGVTGHGARGVAQGTAGMRVSSKSDAARAKIHPVLRDEIAATPDATIEINIYARAGTDVSRYMLGSVTHAYTDPLGNTFITGNARGMNVTKIAGVDGVIMVQPLKLPLDRAVDPDSTATGKIAPSAAAQARMGAIMRAGQRGGASLDSSPKPSGWYDVLNDHESSLAWEKGYTGAGVRVMVNDTGIDFAHPDLYGTWATVEDPASPYYGWPMMFDSASMYDLASDYYIGTTLVASGESDYSDTSAVVTEDAPSYQSLDATEPHDYVLPGSSMSGEYHIGTHPDNSLRNWYRIVNDIPLDDEDAADQRPAILVVDEHQAGVYDTVYVDLNFNYDFSDDTPATKDSPVTAVDWWGALDPTTGDFDPQPDGLNDESGGLVYFIADGVNPVPASDWNWGLPAPANGSLVSFSIIDTYSSDDDDHGQLCSSNVAGQGVINADSFRNTSQFVSAGDTSVVPGASPAFKPDDVGGMVQGAGRDVQLVSNGNFYESGGGYDFALFAMLGYDGIPNTGDEIQIISNSWGNGFVNNDGWDFGSRLLDILNRNLSPTTLIVFSASNSAPGFGTISPPAPPSALKVGASTQFGSTNWDTPAGADQITYGDVASFSARGPGARGDQGIDILGNGMRGSGDVPLNLAMYGANAWQTWGGTSRSTPVVVGNAALMYQAYRETYGTWPDFNTSKTILMSGARDINYDPFLQGAGMVNANRAVDIASGAAGFSVSPNALTPGDYNGLNAPGFASIMSPGESSDSWLTVNNPTDNWLYLTTGDRWLQKFDTWQTDWTSSPVSDEAVTVVDGDPSMTSFNLNMPNYLWNVTDLIPDGTDVAVFRHNYAYDQFDPGQTYLWEQVNDWVLLTYDWTDNNGNGTAWVDLNGDGTVQADEFDQGELVRFDYGREYGTSEGMGLQRPLERSHDGVFIGLQHRGAREDIPQTTLTLGLDFYHQVDFPWVDIGSELAVPPHGDARIKATVNVPGDAPAGLYEGALWFNDGGWNTTVPVTINVAGRGYNMTAGGSVGESWYDNGQIYGSQAWDWGPDSGDWRFYFADLGDNPAGLNRLNGTEYWMVQADWDNLPTDLNINLFGPTPDDFSDADPDYFGPYGLAPIAESESGWIRDGTFLTMTSSGDSNEFVGAPYIPGLNVIAIDNVNYDGAAPSEPFSIQAGVMSISQSPIEASRSTSNGSYSVTESVVSTMNLSGLITDGFGLSKPTVYTGQTVLQDDPNDPTTASYTKEITLEHAGALDVAVDGGDSDDLDLFLYYDFNGDSAYDPDELVAVSAGSTADEAVSVALPPDGNYLIAVHGWSVPAGETTFDMSVNAVQGNSIGVSGLPEGGLQAGQRYTFKVNVDANGYEPGVYSGLILLGPPEGPGAISIPITFEVTE